MWDSTVPVFSSSDSRRFGVGRDDGAGRDPVEARRVIFFGDFTGEFRGERINDGVSSLCPSILWMEPGRSERIVSISGGISTKLDYLNLLKGLMLLIKIAVGIDNESVCEIIETSELIEGY